VLPVARRGAHYKAPPKGGLNLPVENRTGHSAGHRDFCRALSHGTGHRSSIALGL
jgi:hypothetical protein